MGASKYFRNRQIKDKLKMELLAPTSLPIDTYKNKLPSVEQAVEYGVIYKEMEFEDIDILYVAEGKKRYGRAFTVYKDGRYSECTFEEWLRITNAMLSAIGDNMQ